jgi:cytochrome c peroxidase
MRSRNRTGWAIILGAASLAAGCGGYEQAPAPQALSARPVPAIGPLAAPKSPDQIGAPAGITRASAPMADPRTTAEVLLGEKLFFEPRLSVNGTVACATCHDPAWGFTDRLQIAVGVKGRVGQRNSPSVLNALYNRFQFWDGRARTLQQQAALPLTNPVEMAQPTADAAAAAIADDRGYQQDFRTAFGRAPNATDLVQAIAAYERTQFSFNAPFDRFTAGDQSAISESAKRGWTLFNGKARCNSCHGLPDEAADPALFTDRGFHNIGVGVAQHDVVRLACRAETQVNAQSPLELDRAALMTDLTALGRYLVTRRPADIAAFKTPGLRNVMITAPYFHDGSHTTLWDVVDHYNKGGEANPWLDPAIQPLGLTDPEIDDLVEFLATLTSAQYGDLGEKELARQRELAHASRPDRDTARAFGPKFAQPTAALVCTQPVAMRGAGTGPMQVVR